MEKMIIPKMLINQVANTLTKHFKLDKMMSYVFDDNILDKKTKQLERRVKMLEKLSHAPREFVVCETCKKQIKEK
jgi:nicotinic acid mononucleotide adenylyltransferase